MMVEIPNKAPSRVYLTVWEELSGAKPDCAGEPLKRPRVARKMLVTKKAAFAWRPPWAKESQQPYYPYKKIKPSPGRQTVISYELSHPVIPDVVIPKAKKGKS
jgi:hypothetical protein